MNHLDKEDYSLIVMILGFVSFFTLIIIQAGFNIPQNDIFFAVLESIAGTICIFSLVYWFMPSEGKNKK